MVTLSLVVSSDVDSDVVMNQRNLIYEDWEPIRPIQQLAIMNKA